MIVGERPLSARMWLSGQQCPYWWRWFKLGLIWMLFALPLLGASEFLGVTYETEPSAGTRTLYLLSAFASAWFFVLSMGLVGWLFPRTFLSLAAIAIGKDEAFRANGQKNVTKADCSALALGILLATAPFLLASTTIAAWFAAPSAANNSLRLAFGYALTSLASYMLDFLAMVVFASLLSLFYRARVVEHRPLDLLSPQSAVK